ncbi:MAG: efflux RND transporter periplasmic adaptor subunit [Candidatus Thiodiazotropha sp. (ex Semelilucina semeliformis)]|nr:efflux RND transporter periplasmic adaptor subunit [Candidatus Thiodiazotropha sp. (ex Myrtea spinifera)]MCU7807036.1 efflux RND transporter periplasmic adaptor subunit [Candidatus Thiodiazotropha sp. (ex Semelilucina semeliformis)]MCU7828302.1 efflux RND transporter periplasmic adaptor subunit [Candidatus Thiodiazotropha sp. (ex Myrtea sp. 'scaly one' KF741663)]
MNRSSSLSFSLLLLMLWMASDALAEKKPAPQVIVAEVREADFVDRIEALGTLKANESVALTVNVTETVTAIHFDDGERVEKGATLVEMTNREEHALLREARANLDEAKRQFKRVKRLESQGIEAQSLLDQRRREVDTARARLSAIESRLADRLIKAPFSGVLGLRNTSVGALVETGDTITTLDDDSVMKLEFAVPSTYLTSLRPGLSIRAHTRAYREQRFDGEVKVVDSRVDPINRSVVVRAVIANPQRMLKPGMLMTVELLRDPRKALLIPESALMPKGSEQFVMRVSGEQHLVDKRQVIIGSRRPGEVEVTQGLEAGEWVITHGTEKARAGKPVRIKGIEDSGAPISELLKPADEKALQGGT